MVATASCHIFVSTPLSAGIPDVAKEACSSCTDLPKKAVAVKAKKASVLSELFLREVRSRPVKIG